MQDNIITLLTFAVGILAIVIGTYGQIAMAQMKRWSEAKLAANGLKAEAKWQADLKAGLLTGAKAALLEGKPLPEAIKAAIAATLASNPDAIDGLKPAPQVLEGLAKAAVADAAAQIAATAANASIAGGTAGPAVGAIVASARA